MSQEPEQELEADFDMNDFMETVMAGMKYDPADEPPHGECMFPDAEFTEDELKKFSAKLAKDRRKQGADPR